MDTLATVWGSHKQELNLAVGPKIAVATVLNFAVWYGITMHIIYMSKKYWLILIWRLQRQTAKL